MNTIRSLRTRYLESRYIRSSTRFTLAALKTVFLAHLFLEYGYAIGNTAGASMLPTLEVKGDVVVSSKAYRRGRGIVVGDVVEFDSVTEPGSKVIKRVLGLEGDYVMRNSPGSAHENEMLQVPKGHCWVVGDNLDYSRDSRHFGPFPLALIRGKVIATILPWNERRWIKNGLNPVGA